MERSRKIALGVGVVLVLLFLAWWFVFRSSSIKPQDSSPRSRKSEDTDDASSKSSKSEDTDDSSKSSKSEGTDDSSSGSVSTESDPYKPKESGHVETDPSGYSPPPPKKPAPPPAPPTPPPLPQGVVKALLGPKEVYIQTAGQVNAIEGGIHAQAGDGWGNINDNYICKPGHYAAVVNIDGYNYSACVSDPKYFTENALGQIKVTHDYSRGGSWSGPDGLTCPAGHLLRIRQAPGGAAWAYCEKVV